jgi:hypothetical protein
MIPTAALLQTSLRSVTPPLDETLPLATPLALAGQDVPLWARRLLTPPLQLWVANRWDPATSVFTFRATDPLTMSKRAKDLGASLAGPAPQVALAVLASLAADAADGTKATPTSVRAIVRAASEGAARHLHDLDDKALSQTAGMVLRRWRMRLEIVEADPETEWDRDEIRLPVVKPGAPAHTLRVGDVSQPWLRDLLVNVLRVRIHHIADRTSTAWVREVTRLSQFLDTRPDHGVNPHMLGHKVMDQYATVLRTDPGITQGGHIAALNVVSSVVSQARALGFADQHSLAAGFTVHSGHYPTVTKVVRADRGFPDATFRFLLGADELLGPRVLDLARSVPADELSGEVFVTALQLAANFGRRPDELCSLPAHRLRVADTGAAELLYTNFKSGRDRYGYPPTHAPPSSSERGSPACVTATPIPSSPT